MDPFRFFAIDLENAFFLGLAYDHFIAGGDSIVVLLKAIADRYHGKSVASALELYPPTHARLFVRHPLDSLRAIARFPGMAASCRRTIRPRYRSIEDGYNAFTLFSLEARDFTVLRNAAKRLGVTLNDALIALLLLAQDAQAPQRDRTKRRHELAVASIMNLRDAHGEDVERTFGQFLSSFRVSHAVPAGITDGARLRVRNMGHAGRHGGGPGDLYITVHVQPHPFFRREGDDLVCPLPVAVHEAALGAAIPVPSLEGTIELRVPAGTQAGQRLRVAGGGLVRPSGGRGDLLFDVTLVLPRKLDERSIEIMREFAAINRDDVRSGRFENLDA